jgi:prepilin-type N-terminal cleavage/methylation domain-containing protein
MITIAGRKALKMNSNKGFTLIELMFAIVIIAISVLAVYQMFIQGSQMITEEYHRRMALEKAQEKIEIAKSYRSFCDTVPRNLSGTFSEQLADPEPGQEEGIIATYIIKVEHSADRNATGVPYMSTVTVTYEWAERTGRLLSFKLKTHVIS